MSDNHLIIFAEYEYVKQLPDRLEKDFFFRRRKPAGQWSYPELIFA